MDLFFRDHPVIRPLQQDKCPTALRAKSEFFYQMLTMQRLMYQEFLGTGTEESLRISVRSLPVLLKTGDVAMAREAAKHNPRPLPPTLEELKAKNKRTKPFRDITHQEWLLERAHLEGMKSRTHEAMETLARHIINTVRAVLPRSDTYISSVLPVKHHAAGINAALMSLA